MNKKDKYIAFGCIVGIISASPSAERMNEDFAVFMKWIEEKIDEEEK